MAPLIPLTVTDEGRTNIPRLANKTRKVLFVNTNLGLKITLNLTFGLEVTVALNASVVPADMVTHLQAC